MYAAFKLFYRSGGEKGTLLKQEKEIKNKMKTGNGLFSLKFFEHSIFLDEAVNTVG